MQNSLSITQERHEQRSTGDCDEEGDGGDMARRDAPKESAVRSNASHASVRPLNIKKKPASCPAIEKERPAWLNDAQLAASSSSTSQPRRRTLPVPGAQRQQRSLPTQRLIPEATNEDRSMPPPPFTAVDDSLDGPAYERYPSDGRARRAASPVVLRYTGQDVGASPPPSPPLSPVGPSSMGPELRRRAIPSGYNLSAHSQQAFSTTRVPSPRSFSSNGNKGTAHMLSPPRLEFNPSVAYDDMKSIYGHLPTDPLRRGQAAALYK